MTAIGAHDYWDTYYADEFVFGLGTEHVIELLNEIPPVDSWIDVGAGSESLFWACALSAERLVAVDTEPARLALLWRSSHASAPRGSYRTVLRLSRRTAAEWATVRSSLVGTVVADCLTATPPVAQRADLVTQFGLLGLTETRAQFQRSFAALAQLAHPGGWIAGANWMATGRPDRLLLDEELYRASLQRCRVTDVRLRRIASADPEYPYLLSYLARIDQR